MKWKANLNMTQNVTKQFIRLTAWGKIDMEIHHIYRMHRALGHYLLSDFLMRVSIFCLSLFSMWK